eukprot:6187378-Pleurochrysis_carterae.AAC.3
MAVSRSLTAGTRSVQLHTRWRTEGRACGSLSPARASRARRAARGSTAAPRRRAQARSRAPRRGHVSSRPRRTRGTARAPAAPARPEARVRVGVRTDAHAARIRHAEGAGCVVCAEGVSVALKHVAQEDQKAKAIVTEFRGETKTDSLTALVDVEWKGPIGDEQAAAARCSRTYD